MRVITAPEPLEVEDNEMTIFLAGGIQKTEDWQKKVIESLSQKFPTEKVVLLNPRRDNFPIHDPNAAYEQIKWEYDALNFADVFTMYFASGDTDQPICMYEYGKHLERRSVTKDLKDFVVTSEPSYRRNQDVIIQTNLVDPSIVVGKSLDEHIDKIAKVIESNIKIFELL